MLALNDVALKEWAVICRELAEGRQIIVLRKGGIREPRTGFSVEHQEVAAVVEVTELEALRRLDGQHALEWSAVERRFNYRRTGLHVLALQILRLPEPPRIENLARYDGCRSWVTLDRPYPTSGCQPVLPETEFQRQLLALRASSGCSMPSRQ